MLLLLLLLLLHFCEQCQVPTRRDASISSFVELP